MERNDPSQVGMDDDQFMVIVLGNGQGDIDLTCARVQGALEQAGICHRVLAGRAVATGTRHTKMGIQAIVPDGRLPVEFSIVAPVYNEEENILEFHHRLTSVMTEMGEPYEVILVDDGSRDQSLEILRELHARDRHVRIISLTRNFGHQQAVSAGLDYACGKAVIVLDADLQDPPEVIPQFVKRWRQGIQVVYAMREKRKEGILKRITYHSFYLILRAVAKIDIPIDTGDFCLMDRCVVDALTALPESNRFVRGLRSWVGFKQAGLAYERDVRFAGQTKYTFRKLVSLALDGLIAFSYFPLRLGIMLGFGVSSLSLLATVYYLVKAVTRGLNPPGFATQVVLVSFLGGVQLITIGIIGEYIGHVLEEVKHRPAYVVREVLERKPVAAAKGMSD